MARVLVVFTQGPHGGSAAREGLDVALAAIAFDHEVGVYFTGDGVALLRAGQDPRAAAQKDWCRGFRALAMHGVARVGVDADALALHGLVADELIIAATPCRARDAGTWFGAADVVFNA